MGRIIIAIASLTIAFLLWRWFKTQYAVKGRPFAVKAFIATAAIVLIALAAAGRIHWLGAILASLLAAIRFALPLLIRSLPFLQSLRQSQQQYQQQQNQQSNQKSAASNMTRAEALAILGLDDSATENDIIQAHRKLIQKLHPDRGGNEYLATQLNLAKDVLLNG